MFRYYFISAVLISGGLGFVSEAGSKTGLTGPEVREFAQEQLGLSNGSSDRGNLALDDLVRLLTGESPSVLTQVVQPLQALSVTASSQGGCDLNSKKSVEVAEFIVVHLEILKPAGLGNLTPDLTAEKASAEAVCAPQSGVLARLSLARAGNVIKEQFQKLAEDLTKRFEAESAAREAEVKKLNSRVDLVTTQLDAERKRIDQNTASISDLTKTVTRQGEQLAKHSQELARQSQRIDQNTAAIAELNKTVARQGELLVKHSQDLSRHEIALEAHRIRMDGIDERITKEVSALDKRIFATEEWILDERWARRKLPSMDVPHGAELLVKRPPPYNPPRPPGWKPDERVRP